ncbi:MAG: hypothetical protein JXB42_11590 [Deltaproteobacteria bacterium]|nr:hypothetical protein [Deltaproteobacteria bacterium]
MRFNPFCRELPIYKLVLGGDERREPFVPSFGKISLSGSDRLWERTLVLYKARLSRVGFELFYHLFEHFGTQIIVVSEVGSKRLDSAEVFEERISLIHCYSMELYSQRRNKKLEVELKNGS